jgi:hypothetical protein
MHAFWFGGDKEVIAVIDAEPSVDLSSLIQRSELFAFPLA